MDKITVCNRAYGRCMYDDLTCRDAPETTDTFRLGRPCVGPFSSGTSVTCQLGKCAADGCDGTGGQLLLCGCGCHQNQFNVTISALVETVDHVGAAVASVCGMRCQITREFATNIARVLAEWWLFVVDVGIHTDDLVAWPAALLPYSARIANIIDRGNATALNFGGNLRTFYGEPDATCIAVNTGKAALTFYCCLASAIESAYDITASILEAAADLIINVIYAVGTGLAASAHTSKTDLRLLRAGLEGPFNETYRAMNRTRELVVDIACILLQVIPGDAQCPGPSSANFCPSDICSLLASAPTAVCGHVSACAANADITSIYPADSCLSPPGICAVPAGVLAHGPAQFLGLRPRIAAGAKGVRVQEPGGQVRAGPVPGQRAIMQRNRFSRQSQRI